MARTLIVLLLIASAAYSQDIEISIRPDVLYIEGAAGNLQPMERFFFHVIIHNTSTSPITVQSLQFALGNGQVASLTGRYSGAALTGLFDSAIDRRRIEPTPKQTLVIAPDQRKAVTDIFLEWPLGFVGDSFEVEVHYQKDGKSDSRKSSGSLTRWTGFSGRLPFEGNWYVANEHGYLDHHKRAATEAFAYDFLQIGANGKSYQRDGSRNSDYFAYGKKVLAAKDGTVVAVRSDVAENAPGTGNTDTPGGNMVLVDHGQDQYGYYAHLRANVPVKIGSRIKAGDVIGEVGNTGDAREPHLHFHVMDNSNVDEASPLPVLFENWTSQSYGRTPVAREPGLLPRGEFVESVRLP